MNKMMLTLAFTALIGGGVFAQDNMEKAEKPVDRTEQLTRMMTTRLKLTSEQVPKVKDINDRFAKELATVNRERQDTKAQGQTPVKGDALQKAKAINEKKNAELKAVLTPEQMTEWQRMQAQMEQRVQEKRQARQVDKKQ
jgi:hypothetical protein